MAGRQEGEPLSRRERLKRERRERILDAAAAVFARKGFHQATIHEIADLADVADGTIYNYFDNKLDLLIALVVRVAELEQLPDELLQGLGSDARSFFVTAFQERLSSIERQEGMLQAVLPEVLVNPDLRRQFHQQYVLRVAALLEQYVQAQIERGRFRPVSVPLLVRILQSTFLGMLTMRFLGDDTLQEHWDEVAETLATLIFHGLGAGDGE